MMKAHIKEHTKMSTCGLYQLYIETALEDLWCKLRLAK